jgi:hypothetical protein
MTYLDPQFGQPAKRPIFQSIRSVAIPLALMCTASIAAADAPAVPDTYTAITTSMDPSDVEIKIAVREWSDDASRAAVVEALSAGPDASKALVDLPTVGYVWQSGRAAGHSLKYAHREMDDRGERVTFVTEKQIDSYAFKPWRPDAQTDVVAHDYSVIELYLDANGAGTGTLSLAADVTLDDEHDLVSLAAKAGAPTLLTDAKLEPKPYWANQD